MLCLSYFSPRCHIRAKGLCVGPGAWILNCLRIGCQSHIHQFYSNLDWGNCGAATDGGTEGRPPLHSLASDKKQLFRST